MSETKPLLRNCPFCDHPGTWCDCGAEHCHYIECKSCGVQVNLMTDEAQESEDFPALYALCADAWNRRAGTTP